MKKSVGSYEAKTKLPELLSLVEKGQSFTITKRGKPVAVLSPARPEDGESLDDVVAKIRELRTKHTLGKLSLKKMISTGRK